MFMTTGNVATLKKYEGRGYFTKLFTEIMRELEARGAVAARLGGARQRYGRFGFEPAGISYKFEYQETNRKKCFGDKTDLTFARVTEADTDALAYITRIIEAKPFHVKREGGEGYRDQLLALHTKHSLPYVAIRDGAFVGYLCACGDNVYVGAKENGRNITELGAQDAETAYEIINAWQMRCGATVTVSVAPHEVELIRMLGKYSESSTVASPSHFRVHAFAPLANALMKLKASYTALPDSDAYLEIEDYGTIHLFKHGEDVGCKLTDHAPDLTLDKHTATRLLFGTYDISTVVDAPQNLAAFLPLPLSWNTLDYT